MNKIVCYGDSNTWGYVPGTGERFDADTRWPARLQTELGSEFCVIEEGMNARSTSFDDPFCEGLNGKKTLLQTLMAARPIDLLIISLGTNDLKFTDARGSSKGLSALLSAALAADHGKHVGIWNDAPVILVISPILLFPGIDTREPPSSLKGKYAESLRFKDYYGPVCQANGVFFLDASAYTTASEIDCVHMDAENHKILSVAVSDMVRRIHMYFPRA
ncbi:MAG: GDSL-type esterase/lipase family protein [Lawsonibacter sp.]|nr:GDSL-type esterase/lipase family protein [Lawsonibacter sp.]